MGCGCGSKGLGRFGYMMEQASDGSFQPPGQAAPSTGTSPAVKYALLGGGAYGGWMLGKWIGAAVGLGVGYLASKKLGG